MSDKKTNIEESNPLEKETKKIPVKLIAIILAAAIVIGVVGFAIYKIKPFKFGNTSNSSTTAAENTAQPESEIAKSAPVFQGLKATEQEYMYYYFNAYNSLLSNINQEQSYSGQSSYDFDTTLSPDKQSGMYTDSETGESKSWSQFLNDSAVDQLTSVKSFCAGATKAGLTLDDTDKAQIDEEFKYLQQQADEYAKSQKLDNYTLDEYIKLSIGPFDEAFLRHILEEQLLAYKYQEDYFNNLPSSYSQDVIDKEYNADKSSYDFVDFCVYQFTNDGSGTAKEDADSFLAAITNENDFLKKAAELNKDDSSFDAESNCKLKMTAKQTIQNYFSEDIINWLYDSKTSAGAKKLFTDDTNGAYTVVLLTKPAYQAKTVSVRHILFMTVNQETGEPLSNSEISKAKASAENALNKWKSGNKTEDSFAALATELTEDTGSADNGGLYEDFTYSEMVPPFSKWSYDPARKSGDTGIIETTYGYHVMYFVGASDSDYYDKTIREQKANEDATEYFKAITDKNTVALDFDTAKSQTQINEQIAALLAIG